MPHFWGMRTSGQVSNAGRNCNATGAQIGSGRRSIAKLRRMGFTMFVFMADANTTYLNVGIYTLPEASRLTGVSKERIRRWLHGYSSIVRKKRYSALWNSQLPKSTARLRWGFWI